MKYEIFCIKKLFLSFIKSKSLIETRNYSNRFVSFPFYCNGLSLFEGIECLDDPLTGCTVKPFFTLQSVGGLGEIMKTVLNINFWIVRGWADHQGLVPERRPTLYSPIDLLYFRSDITQCTGSVTENTYSKIGFTIGRIIDLSELGDIYRTGETNFALHFPLSYRVHYNVHKCEGI